MGLANSAATFWMRGKEPPNSLKDPQMCENDHFCENTITVSVGGTCEPGDTMCVLSMQAAGIKGPYAREYKTYDWICLLKAGVLVKGSSFAAGMAAGQHGPGLAARGLAAAGAPVLGAYAGMAGTTAHALASSPAGITVSIMGALYYLNEKCECKGGRNR